LAIKVPEKFILRRGNSNLIRVMLRTHAVGQPCGIIIPQRGSFFSMIIAADNKSGKLKIISAPELVAAQAGIGS